jgi:DNA-binding GntR family transcriptional regulator
MSERMNELSVNLGASEGVAVEPASGAEAIVDCVFRAILERRLPPAAKLSERVLCEVFRTSRSTVRRALLVLAERGTVALLPNRGAFVAVPSSEEARAVFEARQTIEPTIASKAALEVTAEQISHLRRHLEAEAGARDRGASMMQSGCPVSFMSSWRNTREIRSWLASLRNWWLARH